MTDAELVCLGRLMQAAGIKEVPVHATYGDAACEVMTRLVQDARYRSSRDWVFGAMAYGELHKNDR